ncbi:IS66-like element accessory protein TnpA [Pseudooceanicola sp. 502str34]
MVDLTFTPQIEFLSAEDVPRRRHWSDADKIRVVQESHRGHRQVSATARRHGISRSLLTTWRRQYRDGDFAIQSGPAFVPVTMAPAMDKPSPRQLGPDVQHEVVLRNGRRLLVPSSVDPDALARLLPILEGK